MSQIKQLAAELTTAYNLQTVIVTDSILSVEQAYLVQRQKMQYLDPNPKHWKIGLMNDGEAFIAPITSQDSQRSPGDFSNRKFNALHVEAELAYRLNTDFLPGQHYSEQQVFAGIDAIAVSIEILDSRLQNWQHASQTLHLADNQMNGALVIGEAIKDWQNIDYARQKVELFINRQLIAEDSGSHPQQDPTSLLSAGVNQGTKRGYKLTAGSWITSGTWSGYPQAKAGDYISVNFLGLGEASLQL